MQNIDDNMIKDEISALKADLEKIRLNLIKEQINSPDLSNEEKLKIINSVMNTSEQEHVRMKIIETEMLDALEIPVITNKYSIEAFENLTLKELMITDLIPFLHLHFQFLNKKS